MLQHKLIKYYFLTVLIVIFSFTKGYGTYFPINDTSAINSAIQKARIALDSNRVDESLQLSKLAFEQSQKLDYIKGIENSLLLIGQAQSINGKKDSAILIYKRSLRISRDTRDEFEEGDALHKLGNVYSDIGKLDSAEFFYTEAIKVKQKINDKYGIAKSLINLGLIYVSRGKYPKALEYYNNSLSLTKELTDKKLQPAILNNIGLVFWHQGYNAEALDYFFKSLNISEELNDNSGNARIYNNIGIIYQQVGDYEQAAKYQNESLEVSKSHNDRIGISYAFLNLGVIYYQMGKYEQALDYYRKSEVIRKELSDLPGLADLYINIGKLYLKMRNPDKSIEQFEEAELIYKKIDMPYGIANCLIQTGLTKFEIHSYNDAIIHCKEGIELAKKINALELEKQGYEVLSKIYEKTDKIPQAFDSYKQFINLRDSLNNIEKSKQLVKIQMQSEFDNLSHKQKLEQDQKLELAQGKSRKQTKIANIFIFAFLLTLSIFILLFISFRQKQRSSDLLEFQKLDVERQKSELTAQRDELEIQKNLVVHQRDKIMTMLTELGESIDYARKIQQALLPTDKKLKDLLGDYFLFFQPRESVGGDFYWVAEYEDLTFFAVADCTGHGVPGGFMSMLGVSLLNEMITRSESLSPAKMLWNLRDMIIKALNQTGLDDDSQDGMDIALCMYNPTNRHLVYSGANSSLVVATSILPEPNDKIFVFDNLVEYKPDRMPAAFYQRMEEFYEHHIVLNPGDCVYLFSDGFADQFGGRSNKKFGYSTYRNLLSSLSKKPFDHQRDILWNEFDKWKGDENQTDDVLVMGIRFS
jgi:tetratricopeptide (TPR) repeat protein